MSLLRYPKYKDSGVGWIGRVPEAWCTKKFRYVFTESSEKIENEVVGPMLSVSGYRGIEIKEYEDENRRRLDEDLIGYRIVREGQLVVNTMWLNYAGLGVSQHEGHVSPAYRSYTISDVLHRPFAHHLMRSGSYVQGYTRLLTGIRPNSLQMSRDDLMAFPILIPPLPEQKAIACFLDRETVKIDTLVAEQERLIELLKEKRQGVISHAVNKGLNPDVPMKDSGIEWLGEIPAHWAVGKLCRLVATRKGIAFKAESFTDEGVFVVKASDIKNLTLRRSDTCLPLDFIERFAQAVLSAGEIVLSTVGSVPEVRNSAVGQMAQVPHEFAGSLLNQNTVVFSPSSSDVLTNRFLFTVLQTNGYRDHLDLHAHGTANQASLNVSDMLNFFVPLPHPIEQIAIVGFLSDELKKFDTLTSEAQRAIDLLQERRTALISAAVTGQIDVREAAGRAA